MKGLLYKKYQYLGGLRDNSANFKWLDKVAKASLGMNRDTWIQIQKNGGFFTAKGVPRQRKQKSLLPERESKGKGWRSRGSSHPEATEEMQRQSPMSQTNPIRQRKPASPELRQQQPK